MSVELLARWATRWDREALVEMVHTLALQHGCATTPQTVTQAFQYALAHPEEIRFCVVERDHELLGVCSMRATYSTWRAMPFGTLEDVYVRPEARRMGVATKMLEFVRDQAVRKGFCRLELHVAHDNDIAQNCYKTFGMRDTGYIAYELPLIDFDEAE